MSHYVTMRLVAAGAALALAGCVATTPERGGQAAPATTSMHAPTVSGSMSESGAQTVFEARGIAYLGGDFSQTREQAYSESKRRLFDAGATIHLSAVQATTFGTLTTDCAMQVASGTLLDFEVLEEGIENEARYFVRAKARFEKREAKKALGKNALKKIGCWSGEEKTADEVEVTEPSASDAPTVATADTSATVKGSAASGMSGSTSGAGTQTAESRSPEPAEKTPTTVAIVSAPATETTVCCHEFPDPLIRKVYPVLERIEGVTRLQRLTTNDGSLCYRFHYEGPLDLLERQLQSKIRTSSALPFKIRHDRGSRMIDLVFDGGFD